MMFRSKIKAIFIDINFTADVVSCEFTFTHFMYGFSNFATYIALSKVIAGG